MDPLNKSTNQAFFLVIGWYRPELAQRARDGSALLPI